MTASIRLDTDCTETARERQPANFVLLKDPHSELSLLAPANIAHNLSIQDNGLV